MIQLRLMPLNQQVWRQYTMFLGSRKAYVPNMQPHGVFIGLDNGTLIAGVLLYPTAGEYVFAENMTTNPLAPLKLRHRAVQEVIDGVVRYSAMLGKRPMVLIRHRSLGKMLHRYGFTAQPTVCMSLYPAPVVSQINDTAVQEGGLPAASGDRETSHDAPRSVPEAPKQGKRRK